MLFLSLLFFSFYCFLHGIAPFVVKERDLARHERQQPRWRFQQEEKFQFVTQPYEKPLQQTTDPTSPTVPLETKRKPHVKRVTEVWRTSAPAWERRGMGEEAVTAIVMIVRLYFGCSVRNKVDYHRSLATAAA